MNDISLFEASDFNIDRVLQLKGNKKIFVVFSTFGEREAEMIYDKIKLLRSACGDFIDKIFLSHRREEDSKIEQTEIKAKQAGPDVEVLICNSLSTPDMGDEKGKGADMRRTLYQINMFHKDSSSEKDIIVVFLDADVLSAYFGSHFVTGLAGVVLEGFDFAKASFHREMGRVKKFVAQPLFSIIQHPNIKKLSSFAYPLSGEVAGTLEFFNSVCFWQIYGVETGINIDACFGEHKIADVNLGLYDHEHHPDAGIQKMSFGILRTFFLQLIEYGIIELKDGAEISDVFRASYIAEMGKRQTILFIIFSSGSGPLSEQDPMLH